MIAFLLLIVGLAMVVYGANVLVDGASSLAKKYQIPNIVIGLTVVAFGTSAPELAVTAYAAATGNSEIALGNVVGSNICNILLILGLTAIINPLSILKNTVIKEIPLSLLAAVILFFIINDISFGNSQGNMISFSDGIVLLSFFIIFMYYLVNLAQNSGEEEDLDIPNLTKYMSLLYIIGGLVLLLVGGKLFVDNAVNIALGLGMSQAVIGLTIVAFGTSLPELATSIVAAYKKNADIAVGNVVGSCIMNIFLILGVGAVISPLQKGSITDLDLYVVIGANVLLLGAGYLFGKNKITKSEGFVFLLCYILYIAYQVGQVMG